MHHRDHTHTPQSDAVREAQLQSRGKKIQPRGGPVFLGQLPQPQRIGAADRGHRTERDMAPIQPPVDPRKLFEVRLAAGGPVARPEVVAGCEGRRVDPPGDRDLHELAVDGLELPFADFARAVAGTKI